MLTVFSGRESVCVSISKNIVHNKKYDKMDDRELKAKCKAPRKVLSEAKSSENETEEIEIKTIYIYAEWSWPKVF